MLQSFFTGIAGVNVHQQWLDVLGNNIANVNTTGFKKDSVQFADVLSRTVQSAQAPEEDCTMGGTNPKQIGAGVLTATINTIYSQGAVNKTDQPTDLAIEGDGFFVINGVANNFYTRAGNLDFDSEGNLVSLTNGYKVQGWMANELPSGDSYIDRAELTDVKIDLRDVMAPKATNKIVLDGNLDADSPFALDNSHIDFIAPVVSTDSVVHTLIGYDSFGNKMVYADDTDNWRYLDGSLAIKPDLTSSALDTSRSFSDAGWTKVPTGSVTINGARFDISNYSTVDNFVDAINSNAQAGVNLSYSEATDKWTFTPLHQGEEFTMSETPANSNSVGFFTANNFLVDEDGKIEVKEEVAKILFRHLFNPQDPTELMFRWTAVDATTYDQILPTFISKREVIDCMETLNLSAGVKEAFEKERPTGTITINNYTSNDIASYDSLQQLIEEINGSEAANATISYDPVNDRFTLVSKSAAAELTTSETYTSSNGAVVSGTFLDDANADGKIDGEVIGKIDGVVSAGTIVGRSAGLATGNVESGLVTGELIGYIEGKFDGEGIFSGDLKLYNGYIKGDVSALDGVTDVLTPTNNAWIDGTIKGSALGVLNGTMVGFVKTLIDLNADGSDDYGDFRINGHITGHAQADTGTGGIYGSIVGDAGISDAVAAGGFSFDEVTITGPGAIQGSVGGIFEDDDGGGIYGMKSIADMITANDDPGALTADQEAGLTNITVNGAVMGTLTGTGTGTLYTFSGGVWDAGAVVTNYTFTGAGNQALVGSFDGSVGGSITGIAQGDITLNSTSTVTGVIAGLDDSGTDHDGNGVMDAYITINAASTSSGSGAGGSCSGSSGSSGSVIPAGKLVGDFEGQVDIHGEIFQDEAADDEDWVSAVVNVSGWAYAYFDSTAAGAGGYFKGTLDGEAHGEIWGLVKHAAVVAQHFNGVGYTAFDHGNIKFEGTFTGRANDADDHNLTDSISNIIEGLATNGAVVNGIVDGSLDVSGTNQYFNGACSGVITATAAGDDYGITGRIIGEVNGTGELNGDYDGYMTGTGSIDGELFGRLSSSAAGADATFTGKAKGTIRGKITGYVKGILANTGPVDGYMTIDNGILYGEVEGTVTATTGGQTIIDGEAEGTFSGTILGQIDAEKDAGRGLFTRLRMGTGTKAPTSGLLELENDKESADYGLIINNFINPDANSPSEIHQNNELLDISEEAPDITKHDWSQTTSDGKDYFTMYYAGNEVAIFIPNGQTKGPEAIHFGPNMTDEVPGTITANHISQETVALRDDYEYKVSKTVYDSEGNSYNIPFTFERVNEKVWLWWAEDPAEGGVAGYGFLEFKADGTINEKAEWAICQSPKDPFTFDSDNGWLGGDSSIGYKGIYLNPPGTPHPYDAGGSPPTEYGPNILKIDLDFSTLTEFDAFFSNAYVKEQDGYPMGTLTEEPVINSDGRLIGTYSNGLTREMAQIALATFANPEGLSKAGDTMFRQTANSGEARLETPGEIRAGSLRSGVLEASNVSLTDEFTNMILAQRAFSANVRTITAAEQMMNEILRMRG